MASLPIALPVRDVPIAPPDVPNFVTYPGSPFRLNQPYPPAGDQPQAIV